MTIKGSCACKAITYTVEEDDKKEFHACHCTTCQAWTGGVALSFEGGKHPILEDPENNLGVWASSDWAERCFCKRCGSSLFSRLTMEGDMKGMHYICAGGVESDRDDWGFGAELFVDCKPSSYCFKTGKDHKALTKAETEAMFASEGSV